MNERAAEFLLSLWNEDVELCGFVLKDGQIYLIDNAAQDPSRNFCFSTESLKDFLMEHSINDVDGMFHTHPSGRTSPTQGDIEGWPQAAVRYYVVTQTTVHEWSKNGDGSVRELSGPAMAS